jgi:hypothetical protein
MRVAFSPACPAKNNRMPKFENRQNKSSFPQAHQVFPGHQTIVNLRVDAVLVQIALRLARRLRLRAAR